MGREERREFCLANWRTALLTCSFCGQIQPFTASLCTLQPLCVVTLTAFPLHPYCIHNQYPCINNY
ncbi:hypothetical protein [Escherichia phage UPEC06]|nr:hypothetical protein [Escherichia phage UPEC06]